ncbi:MAG TPA: oligopeptide/dipeptide ABC transporter ATP-binding protein [Devosia sp.]|jgi:oligopeptide/dipeptide ABC transporter ATP-binding protein|nr:oligopeptide/dipeptide ABC transporter ATP-binding protein [Devosia sp.]
MSEPLLKVVNLEKRFALRGGRKAAQPASEVKAVSDVSFEIGAGETFSLIGESGCGKSTTAKMILRLIDPDGGAIWFDGEDIAGFEGSKLTHYRRSVQAVFQDPYSSLSPRMRIGSAVGEPLVVHGVGSRNDIRDRVRQSLEQVGLRADAMERYPHEFSGGQRQRIALARALVLDPKLIVLDEPVSALDVSVRAQIMNLMKDLQQKTGVAYLLIAHGPDTVRYMSHRVGVMYLGRLVELAEVDQLFARPSHPYSQALLSAALPTHPSQHRNEIVLSGELPSPLNMPQGCPFHTRCFRDRVEACFSTRPELRTIVPGQSAACHLA